MTTSQADRPMSEGIPTWEDLDFDQLFIVDASHDKLLYEQIWLRLHA